MANHELTDSAEKDEKRNRKKTQQICARVKKDGGEQCTETHRAFPSLSTAEAVLGIQQTYGNKYVQRLVERKGKINGKSEDVIASQAHSKHGQGNPLLGSLRQRAEDTLGEKLDNVRVHADPESDLLVNQAGALAFTVGQDIFLRENALTGDNSELDILAHEVVHTVQQKYGSESDPEYEAEHVGQKILKGEIADLGSGQKNPVPALQRQGSAGRGAITCHLDQVTYYDLYGRLARVHEALRVRAQTGKYRCWGSCTSDIKCDVVSTDNKGRITALNVNVNTIIQLPKWAGDLNTLPRPKTAQDEWDRMSDCLWRHEYNHYSKTEEHASKMQMNMIGTPNADCDTNWEKELAKHQTLVQDKYDKQTRNGYTEGVDLNDSTDPRTAATNTAALETETEEAVAGYEAEPESAYETEEVAGYEAEPESEYETEEVAAYEAEPEREYETEA